MPLIPSETLGVSRVGKIQLEWLFHGEQQDSTRGFVPALTEFARLDLLGPGRLGEAMSSEDRFQILDRQVGEVWPHIVGSRLDQWMDIGADTDSETAQARRLCRTNSADGILNRE